MGDSDDLTRFRTNLENELEAAVLYRTMSAAESDPALAELYGRLAAVEEKHARFWEIRIRKLGGSVETWRPGWRTRVKIWLARHWGPQVILPLVAATEYEGRTTYDAQPETADTGMSAEERAHARILGRMLANQGGMPGSSLARLEGRHRGTGGNTLRAAVLGSGDGLVSNLSLVMGVAGAQLGARQILVTGAAGLLAGACSMAIGEWISVQSSRELNQRQLDIEADELRQAPEEEEEELALIYQAKGLQESEARVVAARLIADKDKALDTLAREELGIDPQDLGGSAWAAAITSFALFAVGAAIPLAPFLLTSGRQAVWASLACSAAGLYLLGAAITLVTGRSAVYSGMRQLVFGLLAAAVTYGIGHLIGVRLAG